VIGDQSVQYPKESNRDMSLDDQKAKSNRFVEAPEADSTLIGAREDGESRIAFKVTDFVVYPTHGAGQILSIEEQTVVGSSLEFFVIYFTKSKMTVRVPVGKAAKVGMRKLSDLSVVQAVKQVLSEAPRKARGNWSKQVQEYESKINSGDISAVAEVVRDLFRPDDLTQSFSERQLYVSALDRLCGEVALVGGVSEEQAIKEFEALLRTGKLKRSA
jgi:CarD family transcriptional regulator